MPPRGQPDDLERTALLRVPGSGPVTIEPLGAGLVNDSYRVMRAGRAYSLRVPAPEVADLGLDRAWECSVLERASAAGLAPIIECCEPARGLLVTRWVPGRPWSSEQAREPKCLAQLAALARRIHALPPPAPPRLLTPADWVAHYRAVLEPAQAASGRQHRRDRRAALSGGLEAQLEPRLAALQASPHHPVLCHSDLHVENLIAGEAGLVLLDWEYAHVSEGLWDLAGWACNNDLDRPARTFLLASYLERPPAAREVQRLELLVWLYGYVCLLWMEVYVSSRGSRPHLIASGQRLARRLARAAAGRVG
ncbi:MAG TPA: choline/ethanolamine kinase family protein [Steroidobacteraceae bacterium]|nr:choline/ethanolamine kinase family protein [Steroidobacteraceae bacterium]